MKGRVGLFGRPTVDGLPTYVVTHQLEVERRTGKVRPLKTNVPLWTQPTVRKVAIWKRLTTHKHPGISHRYCKLCSSRAKTEFSGLCLHTNSGETFIDQNSWTDSTRRHTSFDDDMRGCFFNRSASLYVQLYSFTDLQHCTKFYLLSPTQRNVAWSAWTWRYHSPVLRDISSTLLIFRVVNEATEGWG